LETKPKFCGKCGASIDISNNFCTQCGARIKTENSSHEKSKEKSSKMDEEMTNLTFNIDGKEITIEERNDVAQKIGKIMGGGGIKEELGENVLWKAEKKQGFLKKPIIYSMTNYRILCLYPDEKLIQFPLNYIDVVVMNTHRASARTGIGGFTTLARGFGIGGMQSTGKSVTVGDVNFLFQGEILITIPDVIDPIGLKNLVIAVKKQTY
jgi:hypothetical protein